MPVEVRSVHLAGSVDGTLWSPPGLADDAGALLLVVHDGADYDGLVDLTRHLAGCLARGHVPPLRAALLVPGQRDERYSADPAYGRALAQEVLPALRRRVAVSQVVGMGASLGALAWLAAHLDRPGVVDGLFLQSGSFFDDRLDAQERGFRYYPRIISFVERVLAGAGRGVPTVLTCGLAEENLANNRQLALALSRQGWDATLAETPGGHSYPAWRDALDPHLSRLLRAVARAAPV